MRRDERPMLSRLAERRLAARPHAEVWDAVPLACVTDEELDARLLRFKARLLGRGSPAPQLTQEEQEAQSQRIATGLGELGPGRRARVFEVLLDSMHARGEGDRASRFETHLRAKGWLGNV